VKVSHVHVYTVHVYNVHVYTVIGIDLYNAVVCFVMFVIGIDIKVLTVFLLKIRYCSIGA